MTSIALLGTSADPPTCGHQILLEQLLLHYDQVVTWASDNPSKQHGLRLHQRCDLLQALVDSIHDSRLELVQTLSSPWAIRTLELAEARWPNQRLHFVVGSDLVDQILRWKDSDALLQRCRLVVVPRQGWPLHPEALKPLQAQGARIDVLPLPVPGTASSSARRDHDSTQVPAALRPLLQQHGFYGFKATPNSAAP